jgi:hypothetical protein
MHMHAPVIPTRRSVQLAGIALLGVLALVVMGFGRAAAESPGPAEVKETCVGSGLARPPALDVHLWLQTFPAHPGVFMPEAVASFNVAPMPESCEGAYEQILFFKVRYKTGLKPWRTLRAWVQFPRKEKLVAWVPVWTGSDGTGGKLGAEISKEGLEDPQGPVQRVKARARLWIKNASTGYIVGRKTLRVRTTFDRLPHG